MGGRTALLLAALLCCCCAQAAVVRAQQQQPQQQQQPSVSVVVRNGYEFHASLASPTVTWILVAANVSSSRTRPPPPHSNHTRTTRPTPHPHTAQITLSSETCPFPASPQFPATLLERDVTVASLSPAAAAAAAAAGVALERELPAALASQAEARGPFFIDYSHLNGRFQLMPGHTLTWHSVVLTRCRTLSTAGFVTKHAGSRLILNNTVCCVAWWCTRRQGATSSTAVITATGTPPQVEDQGSVCLPLSAAQGVANSLPRKPTTLLPAPPAGQLQATSLAPASAGWCSAAARSGRLPLPQSLLPTLLLGGAANHSVCLQPALLLGSTAWLEMPTPINASSSNASGQQPQEKPEEFTMLAVRSALLCPQPVSVECLRTSGTGARFCGLHGCVLLAACQRAVAGRMHAPRSPLLPHTATARRTHPQMRAWRPRMSASTPMSSSRAQFWMATACTTA
jgi:hypothetical protein